jgi:hypothetical protein
MNAINQILLACAVVLAPSIILAVIYLFTEKRQKGIPTEAKLENLFLMSKDTAVRDSKPMADWRDIALESLKLTKDTKSYCSRTVIKDLSAEDLGPRDYIVSKLRLDFVSPDRFHITQELWDVELGELYDEWVTIGRENYQNAGLWYCTEDGRNDELNAALQVDSILDIVRDEEPVSSEVYQYEGRRYLLLQYGTPVSREVRRGFLETYKDLIGTCQIQIWISLETGLIVKGSIVFKGGTPDGEFAQGEVNQMFTNYDAGIEISVPPWLNIEPDSEGNLIVVNTKVPILPHHP